MMWDYGNWSPLAGLVMGLLMLAFWAVVIWAIVWVVRQLSSRSSTPGARDVLDRRFASGEIDEDEYRDRLAVLSGKRGEQS